MDVNRALPLMLDYQEWLSSLTPFSLETVDVSPVRSPTIQTPFLLVIMRTQGKRSVELMEALEALSRQSCVDFEVIVVVHDSSHEGMESVIRAVESTDEHLQSRISIIAARGGNRSRPLNVGFAMAQGAYCAICDDDDLPLVDWVEAFHDVAFSNPGRVIYAYVLTQWWRKGKMDEPGSVLGPPQETYCTDFDLVQEIRENRCPSIGCCFPTEMFQKRGISFDESLDTLEDWDFLLQAIMLGGIAVCAHPTSIYRLWENYDTSHALYDQKIWEANRLIIRKKLNAMPLFFGPGQASSLLQSDPLANYGQTFESELYVALHGSFSPQCCMGPSSSQLEGALNRVIFSSLQAYGPADSIRFDPCPQGFISLSSFAVDVETHDGMHHGFTIDDIEHDGIRYNEGSVVFLKSDPKVVITLDAPRVLDKVTVSFLFGVNLDSTTIDRAVDLWMDRLRLESSSECGSAAPVETTTS